MRATRALKALVATTACAVVLGGCSAQVSDMPLPGGTDVGDDPIQVTAEFTDVLDLVPQTTVKVNDVNVGKLPDIEPAGQPAILPMHPDLTVGFVLLGDVDLTGTMEVDGRVRVDDGTGNFGPPPAGTTVIVYASRGQCFSINAENPIATNAADCDPTDLESLVDRIEGGAEAQTSADAAGDFALAGVIEGRVDVGAILYDLDGNTLGAVRAAVGSVSVQGNAGDTVTVPDFFES